MDKLAIIGSSDLATLIAHHAVQLDWEIAGFIDNRVQRGTEIEHFGRVLGTSDDVVSLFQARTFDALAIGVGYLQFTYRAAAFERFRGEIPFANLIHRSSTIDRNAILGEGLVILPGCVVDAGVEIRDNVLLNAGVVIAHHTVIGAHSFVGPGAAVAGKATIGARSFIGVNATIVDHVKLCEDARIGAAAVVIGDVADTEWQVGNPARNARRAENAVA